MKNSFSKLIIFLLLTALASCGGNKSGDVSMKPDDSDFSIDTTGLSSGPNMDNLKDDNKSLVEEANKNLEVAQVVKPEEMKIETPPPVAASEGMEAPMEKLAEPTMNDFNKKETAKKVEAEPVVVAESIPMEKPKSKSEIKANGDLQEYRVKKGETLMLIAFKLYGDYGKWKDLKALNAKKIVKEGTRLKYHSPSDQFEWKPEGLPYLVLSGDTLGTISKAKYGTKKLWKKIYENNRPLIKNPNLIFAGFTLYYVPGRGVASERK